MILQISGLTWHAPSPSHYQLDPGHIVDGSTIDVSYLGDCWCLFLQREGDVRTQTFARREEAFNLVAQAFEQGSNK